MSTDEAQYCPCCGQRIHSEEELRQQVSELRQWMLELKHQLNEETRRQQDEDDLRNIDLPYWEDIACLAFPLETSLQVVVWVSSTLNCKSPLEIEFPPRPIGLSIQRLKDLQGELESDGYVQDKWSQDTGTLIYNRYRPHEQDYDWLNPDFERHDLSKADDILPLAAGDNEAST